MFWNVGLRIGLNLHILRYDSKMYRFSVYFNVCQPIFFQSCFFSFRLARQAKERGNLRWTLFQNFYSKLETSTSACHCMDTRTSTCVIPSMKLSKRLISVFSSFQRTTSQSFRNIWHWNFFLERKVLAGFVWIRSKQFRWFNIFFSRF